jgi:hypothetical protein
MGCPRSSPMPWKCCYRALGLPSLWNHEQNKPSFFINLKKIAIPYKLKLINKKPLPSLKTVTKTI